LLRKYLLCFLKTFHLLWPYRTRYSGYPNRGPLTSEANAYAGRRKRFHNVHIFLIRITGLVDLGMSVCPYERCSTGNLTTFFLAKPHFLKVVNNSFCLSECIRITSISNVTNRKVGQCAPLLSYQL